MSETDADGHPIHIDQPDGVERTHVFGYGPCWCQRWRPTPVGFRHYDDALNLGALPEEDE